MPWPSSGLSPYYPYAGTLYHVVQPYRKVTLGVSETFTIPPNVGSFLSTGPFTLKLPDGTNVGFPVAPTLPVSIDSIWPKGEFVITSGAGGNVEYSFFAHA